MLQIRAAKESEYQTVRRFYDALIDAMAQAEYKPGWERDIYPTQEFLLQSIQHGELYVGELDGELVACMVVNHAYNEGYNKVHWSVEAADEELYVIHALGVHPAFLRRGIAKQMARHVIDRAAAEPQIKTIRLDVLEGNLPAEKAYTRLGFVHLQTLQMYYEDTGWTNFKAFEYVLRRGA